MSELLIWTQNVMKEMATTFIWICSSSRTNRMFHILGGVGAEPKMSIFSPLSIVWTTHTKEARCIYFSFHWKNLNPEDTFAKDRAVPREIFRQNQVQIPMFPSPAGYMHNSVPWD